MLEGDEMMNIALSSPIKNVIWRIYQSKLYLKPEMEEERTIINDVRCRLPRSLKIFELFKPAFFLIMERSQANLFLANSNMLQGVGNKPKLWMYGRNLYSYNRVFYYNLRHKENEQRIGRA